MPEQNKLSKLQKIAEQLVNLKLIEVNELTEILKAKYGIEPVAASTPIVVPSTDKEEKVKEEEKTSFNVVLQSAGNSRVSVIKTVRSITGLSIAEAKKVVENIPQPIKEGVGKEDANTIKKELEKAGAKVTLE